MQVKCGVRGQNVVQEYGFLARVTLDLSTSCKVGIQNTRISRLFIGCSLIVRKLTDVIPQCWVYSRFPLSFCFKKKTRSRNKFHEKGDVTIMLYAYSGVRSSNFGPTTG